MSKKVCFLVSGLLLFVSFFSSCSSSENLKSEDVFTREKIISIMHKVNDYQLSHPWKEDDRNWIRGTYYTGVIALYKATEDPRVLDQALRWARKHRWQVGDEPAPANRMTCAQTYLELYFLKKDPAMIAETRSYIDQRIELAENPREVWYYCDALYVGPPAIAMLGAATGEQKYFDYLNKMYWEVTDYLFDEDYGLFYRDENFFDTKTERGRKVFWSRGNGWVIAGIPRVLEYLPQDDPYYNRYLDLFLKMASSISRVQGKDGLWRSNLADPDQYPGPESSGSAFFCYAMSWGINSGVLDKETYLPVVGKAWMGLVNAVEDSGKLGYVQPVGDRPAPARRDQTHEYAVGAFLLAGGQVLKLCDELAEMPLTVEPLEKTPLVKKDSP